MGHEATAQKHHASGTTHRLCDICRRFACYSAQGATIPPRKQHATHHRSHTSLTHTHHHPKACNRDPRGTREDKKTAARAAACKDDEEKKHQPWRKRDSRRGTTTVTPAIAMRCGWGKPQCRSASAERFRQGQGMRIGRSVGGGGPHCEGIVGWLENKKDGSGRAAADLHTKETWRTIRRPATEPPGPLRDDPRNTGRNPAVPLTRGSRVATVVHIRMRTGDCATAILPRVYCCSWPAAARAAEFAWFPSVQRTWAN